jgi:hypothetical protein
MTLFPASAATTDVLELSDMGEMLTGVDGLRRFDSMVCRR